MSTITTKLLENGYWEANTKVPGGSTSVYDVTEQRAIDKMHGLIDSIEDRRKQRRSYVNLRRRSVDETGVLQIESIL